MIAKSDLVILLFSTALLVIGIVRWQQSMSLLPVPRSEEVHLQPPRGNANNAQFNNTPKVAAAPAQTQGSSQSASMPTANGAPTQRPVNNTQVSSSNNSTGPTQDPVTSRINSGTTDSAGAITPATSTGQANELLYGIYEVEPGDYLFKIANKFGTTVETLENINALSTTVIEVGQQIRYPLPAN